MDAHDWWMKVGTKRAEPVVKAAGTSMGYFRHICKCRNRPSVTLASRLATESEKESSGRPRKERAVMTVLELLKTNSQLKARHKQLKNVSGRDNGQT